MGGGVHETVLLFSDGGVNQQDKVREMLDGFERAGWDREEAAEAIYKATHQPIRRPLRKTGP